MKYTAAALCLISATLSLAAPTTTTTSTTTKVAGRDAAHPAGYALPTILKVHDVASNQNTAGSQTATVRRNDGGGAETSTLYDIPIPSGLEGRTCGLVFRAGRVGAGDTVLGEQALDVFGGGWADLAGLAEGNLRGTQLARLRFDAASASGLYAFDDSALPPSVREFPCPAGEVLHWEAAAVGEFDVNIVGQDFAYDGQNVPNGISVAWW
ncbi:hypothetical protein F5X96DRAFT_653941 [Biscogniauxia mediterranea]|nr:hypothetical protein F5X96DRAFT_653941 [Biscogniauxia mediterranea]